MLANATAQWDLAAKKHTYIHISWTGDRVSPTPMRGARRVLEGSWHETPAQYDGSIAKTLPNKTTNDLADIAVT